MSTQKQLVANRANAQRSTGPRTEAGKLAASGNALKHGLTAAQVLIPGEDPRAYDEFRAHLIEEIAPCSHLEAILAHSLVENLWRLRRVPLLENAIFVQAEAQRRHERESEDVLGDLLSFPGVEKKTWAGCSEEEHDTLKRIGSALHDALASNALIKLSTYETRLFRRIEGFLAQLDRLRGRREADGASEVQKMDRAPGPLIDGEALDTSWTTSQ